MIYIFTLVITFLLSLIRGRIKEKNIIDSIILIYMIIIYGIRYDVGIDYFSYERQYYDTTGFYGQRELIYDLSMKIFRHFNAPYWVYTLFLGFVLYYVLYLVAKHLKLDYSKVIIYSIITGLMFVSFNLVRQSLAGAIVLFALRYIDIHDFKKYSITIIVASLIHFSAIIFLPFYFFDKLKIHKKKWIYVLIIGITLYLTNAVNSILVYVLPSKYEHFIGGRFDYQINLGVGVLFFVFIAIYFALKSIKSEDEMYPYYSLYILGYTALLFTLNVFIMTRINLYSRMSLIYVLPDAIKKIRISGNMSRILDNLLFFGFLVIFIFSIYNMYQLDVNNLMYKTVFRK